MLTLTEVVAAAGGIVQKSVLTRAGARDRDLTRAVRSGALARVRRGWYTTLAPDDGRVRAVRVGGSLTGLSAVAYLGGWTPRSDRFHVSVAANAGRLRDVRTNVVVHWRRGHDSRDADNDNDNDNDKDNVNDNVGAIGLAPLLDVLECVILVEPHEVAVATLDWALHTGRLDRIDFAHLIARLPANRRAVASWVDESCESFPESLTRTRLRLRGHTVETQVRLGDFERIDLVVDGTVALETDGDEYHRDRFETDRRKDLSMTLAGFHAVRASARSVFREWSMVLASVEAALAQHGIVVSVDNSGDRRAVRGRMRVRTSIPAPRLRALLI